MARETLYYLTPKDAETIAKQAGWVTDKFDIGLLLLRA